MTVWDSLVGQDAVVATLRTAAASAARGSAASAGTAGRSAGEGASPPGLGESAASRSGMTHSWLFTGPSGSGRQEAARAFAASLNCERDTPGCGECAGCHTVLTDTAADLRTITPEGLSLGVKDVRALVRDAASAPTAGRWRILLLTDADRLTEAAANALLKALEEPAERAVFLLCAPAVSDVLPTIRSRCRTVALRLPTAADVLDMLLREGVDERTAQTAARASQGHLALARRLATDEAARAHRAAVLRIPSRIGRVGDCLAAAAELVNAANADAEAAGAERDEAETEALKTALGVGATASGGKSRSARAPKAGAKARTMVVRGAAGALKELERTQKSRGRRTILDSLDRALVDLAGLYRDVLAEQLGAPVDAIHPDQAAEASRLAAASTPDRALRCLEAVLVTRTALADNPGLVPLLAVESLILTLREI
ncbi:DNA polymerase III, delta' subunit [Frankia canadensis]|uniref:DNA polymerase III, delta' subunit n=1 Tax=Frankia canadensis TaxID=1836972 RepID=A0A2I2KM23_9ACTN|nr:DNA polymerase III subunit delta' [Frankia canadensis]SNQ46717.1 DNA polymerase III, delta' subunit [Frankia canadensis]SOU54007.1 DNA polymerase III, delta' subunit [Frankia canadensis]